uniref:Uncharacterized protein n=1 Tax=Chromera velia CCMP2878 TaxID=1169474 RepID=A0A0G4H3H0_9ALVE|eukprot:Cvel_24555.t1-p1 / transcript=Cvel_24555.t1 / gene=Cvel_24555 / organism=Chromera_velia_CCMP2878 / gene_product=hypothetical protein / transcript_product=hypothetical protein / location=Cvel_scaffold2669:9892-18894(+) / protein_length=1406 / sequence_SO=supercontig / SO=protein_coding / is_pseudo=false
MNRPLGSCGLVRLARSPEETVVYRNPQWIRVLRGLLRVRRFYEHLFKVQAAVSSPTLLRIDVGARPENALRIQSPSGTFKKIQSSSHTQVPSPELVETGLAWHRKEISREKRRARLLGTHDPSQRDALEAAIPAHTGLQDSLEAKALVSKVAICKLPLLAHRLWKEEASAESVWAALAEQIEMFALRLNPTELAQVLVVFGRTERLGESNGLHARLLTALRHQIEKGKVSLSLLCLIHREVNGLPHSREMQALFEASACRLCSLLTSHIDMREKAARASLRSFLMSGGGQTEDATEIWDGLVAADRGGREGWRRGAEKERESRRTGRRMAGAYSELSPPVLTAFLSALSGRGLHEGVFASFLEGVRRVMACDEAGEVAPERLLRRVAEERGMGSDSVVEIEEVEAYLFGGDGCSPQFGPFHSKTLRHSAFSTSELFSLLRSLCGFAAAELNKRVSQKGVPERQRQDTESVAGVEIWEFLGEVAGEYIPGRLSECTALPRSLLDVLVSNLDSFHRQVAPPLKSLLVESSCATEACGDATMRAIEKTRELQRLLEEMKASRKRLQLEAEAEWGSGERGAESALTILSDPSSGRAVVSLDGLATKRSERGGEEGGSGNRPRSSTDFWQEGCVDRRAQMPRKQMNDHSVNNVISFSREIVNRSRKEAKARNQPPIPPPDAPTSPKTVSAQALWDVPRSRLPTLLSRLTPLEFAAAVRAAAEKDAGMAGRRESSASLAHAREYVSLLVASAETRQESGRLGVRVLPAIFRSLGGLSERGLMTDGDAYRFCSFAVPAVSERVLSLTSRQFIDVLWGLSRMWESAQRAAQQKRLEEKRGGQKPEREAGRADGQKSPSNLSKSSDPTLFSESSINPSFPSASSSASMPLLDGLARYAVAILDRGAVPNDGLVLMSSAFSRLISPETHGRFTSRGLRAHVVSVHDGADGRPPSGRASLRLRRQIRNMQMTATGGSPLPHSPGLFVLDALDSIIGRRRHLLEIRHIEPLLSSFIRMGFLDARAFGELVPRLTDLLRQNGPGGVVETAGSVRQSLEGGNGDATPHPPLPDLMRRTIFCPPSALRSLSFVYSRWVNHRRQQHGCGGAGLVTLPSQFPVAVAAHLAAYLLVPGSGSGSGADARPGLPAESVQAVASLLKVSAASPETLELRGMVLPLLQSHARASGSSVNLQDSERSNEGGSGDGMQIYLEGESLESFDEEMDSRGKVSGALLVGESGASQRVRQRLMRGGRVKVLPSRSLDRAVEKARKMGFRHHTVCSQFRPKGVASSFVVDLEISPQTEARALAFLRSFHNESTLLRSMGVQIDELIRRSLSLSQSVALQHARHSAVAQRNALPFFCTVQTSEESRKIPRFAGIQNVEDGAKEDTVEIEEVPEADRIEKDVEKALQKLETSRIQYM